MLTLDHVNQLTETMIATGVTTLEVKGYDYSIRLVRAPDAAPRGRPTPIKTQATSPATGQFQPRGVDDGLPPLAPGAQVHIGDVLGYIAVGPVRFLCASPVSGRLVGTFPSEGDTIAVKDPVFTVEGTA